MKKKNTHLYFVKENVTDAAKEIFDEINCFDYKIYYAGLNTEKENEEDIRSVDHNRELTKEVGICFFFFFFIFVME